MPKRTTWNQSNPIRVFNDHLLDAKRHLRSLSNEDLKRFAIDSKIPGHEGLKRGSLIRLCLAAVSIAFKAEWKERYGWDFDDARDNEKLRRHLANMKQSRQLQLKKELAENLKQFIGKDKSDELDTQMRTVAQEVYTKYASTYVPSTSDLHEMVEALAKQAEETAKANKEAEGEVISWQKAKGILGSELYEAAKHSGEATSTDGQQRVTYVDKKWYLHA